MRILTLCLAASLCAAPALANWSVSQDGAALVENGGNASLSLVCDNNVNTGNKPSWRLEVTQIGLDENIPPRTELGFLTNGARPVYMDADVRFGKFIIDGMQENNNAAIDRLITRLKKASTLTVQAPDANADDITFTLKGSHKAISSVARACR